MLPGRLRLPIAAAVCLAPIVNSAPASAQALTPPSSRSPQGAPPLFPQTPQQQKPQPSPQAMKAADLFQKAAEHQRAGKTDVALSEYRMVVKIAPGAYPAWFNLGLIYQERRDWKEAERCLLQASHIEPKNAIAATQLAKVYLLQRRIQEATTQAARAVALDPKNAQARYALGNCYATTRKFPQAEAQLREAARLTPNNPYAWFDLGSVYGNEKRYPESLAAFQKCVELDPKNDHAWLFIGAVRQELKQYEPAIIAYRRASDLRPQEPAPWFNAGSCYELRMTSGADKTLAEQKADAEQALSAYVHAAELAPKYLPAVVGAARLYFQIGNYRLADQYFGRAVALNPADVRLAGNAAIAETYAANQETEPKRRTEMQVDAEARFKKAIAHTPLSQLYSGLATLYQQESHPEKAEALYTEWIDKLPRDPEPLMRLARLRQAAGKPAEATDYYRRALALAPKNPDAHIGLAHLYEAANPTQTDKVVAEYRLAIQDEPQAVEPHKLLAQFLMRQPTRMAEALAEFAVVKRLAPHDSSAYLAIGQGYERNKQYEEALKEYRDMAAANPADAAPHWYAAHLLEQQKRYDEAVAEYRAIERINPQDTIMVTNVGRILDLAGRHEEAATEYRRLHQKDPSNQQFHTLYAHSLETLGKHDDAVREYQAIAAKFPAGTNAWIQIGDIYREQKRWDDAKAMYLKVIDSPAESVTAYDRLAALFDEQKRPGDWYALLKERVTKRPDDRNALMRLEVAAAHADKKDDVLAFMKDLSLKQQGNVDFMRGYADLLSMTGHADESLAAYRQVAKLVPADWLVRVNIAQQLTSMDRIPEAIGAYEEVTHNGAVPMVQMAEARIKLAALYEKNGQRAEALAQYREALKVEPSNSTATAGLKRLGG